MNSSEDNKIHYLGVPENDMRASLKEILELIDKGEISALAIAGVRNNGNIISGNVVKDSPFSLIGALEKIKKEILEIV